MQAPMKPPDWWVLRFTASTPCAIVFHSLQSPQE